MRCASCQGVYHDATGHRFTATMAICGVCTREFLKWLKGHTQRRWGGKTFYDFAVTSIKPAKG